MDAPQNSAKDQNNDKKPQLSWAQPLSSIKPTPSPAPAAAVSASHEQNHMKRNLIITVVAILVVAGIAWAITGNKESSTDTATPSGSTATTGTNSTGGTVPAGTSSSSAQVSFPSGDLVIASPQNAGLEIAISKVTVQVPTWVVIYESYNGQPGNVLGAALFTNDRSSGAVDLLRGTLPGQSYFAGEARDDGDHMFSMVNDPATRDANGNPITLTFETR